MNKSRCTVLVIFLLCWVSTSHFVYGAFTLPQSTEEEALHADEFKVFEDLEGHISIQEIIGNDSVQSLFQKDFLHTNQYLNTSYWLKIEITAEHDISKRWLFEFTDPHVAHLDFYQVRDDSIISSGKSGYHHPFYNREYRHKNFVYDIYPEKGHPITLYLRINSNLHTGFEAKVYTTQEFSDYSLLEYYLLGGFYGIIFILALYNFFLYFTTKEENYIFYVLYILSCAIYAFTEDGIGFHIIWPNSPSVNIWIDRLAAPLLLTCFLFYYIRFIELNRHYPKILKYILASVAVYFLYAIANGFENIKGSFLYIIPYFITYFSAIRIYLKGYKPARFFIVGFSVILLSFITYYLRVEGIVPSTIFNIYIFNFGFIIEAVMLSVALGDKIKITKAEKDKAQNKLIDALKRSEKLKDKVNRELEEKVAERTTDLNNKTQELLEANKELEGLKLEMFKINARLDKDVWKLRKKVEEGTKARLLDQIVNPEEFNKIFPDDLSCYRFISELKWKNGYTCKKCGHDKYSKGKKPFSRKCTRCKHTESVTTGTLFHALKFSIQKALYLTYITSGDRKKYTLDELSELLELRRNTCWSFRKKVQEREEQWKQKNNNRKVTNWEVLILD